MIKNMIFGGRPEGLITAWSFNRLREFEDCPKRLHDKTYLKKKPLIEEDTSAADRGTRIHNEIEAYIRDINKGFSDDNQALEHHGELIDNLRTKYKNGLVDLEQDWAFNVNWEECGWWDDDVWCRFKLDAFEWHGTRDAESATVYDWKTGKGSDYSKFKYLDQMKSYAVQVFAKYPKLQFVVTRLVFVDKPGKPLEQRYSRAQAETLMQKLNERAMTLTTAKKFPATPAKYTCKFCPYGEENGDKTCEFRYNQGS